MLSLFCCASICFFSLEVFVVVFFFFFKQKPAYEMRISDWSSDLCSSDLPYTPVSFGTLAGRARGDLFDPARITAINDWAVEQGAVFEDVGNWKRARYFPRSGEDMHAAVARECLQVRSSVGIFDASTLGKIEVVGPDAAEFLNRFYVNAWTKLGVGKCRYGEIGRAHV